MVATSARNGKIEFLRFVFCVFILAYHANLYVYGNEKVFFDNISFFKHGYIGVEFFFLVTGYLMAKTAMKPLPQGTSLSKNTIGFMVNKVFAIFPVHIVAFAITFVVRAVSADLGVDETVELLFCSLPNFFFLNKTGIYSKNVIGVEWYISTMLIALFILYPLCKKYKETFTRVIAPVAGIILLGYIAQKYGRFSNVKVWDGIMFKCTVRAICGICFGAFSYAVSERIKNYRLNKKDVAALTVIEIGCYLVTFLYCVSTVSAKFDAYLLLFLMVGVALTFSNRTAFNNVFDNNFVFFLGKISLPIYIVQDVFYNVIRYRMENVRGLYSSALYIFGSIILGLLVYVVSNPLSKIIKKKVSAIQPAE